MDVLCACKHKPVGVSGNWLGQVRAPYRSAHIFFSSAVPPLVLDAIRSCPLLVGALRSLKEVRSMGPQSQHAGMTAISCSLKAQHKLAWFS